MSRNVRANELFVQDGTVSSRVGRVCIYGSNILGVIGDIVTSREGRVSRNVNDVIRADVGEGHVPRGTCE